jgi:hypothetical protein
MLKYVSIPDELAIELASDRDECKANSKSMKVRFNLAGIHARNELQPEYVAPHKVTAEQGMCKGIRVASGSVGSTRYDRTIRRTKITYGKPLPNLSLVSPLLPRLRIEDLTALGMVFVYDRFSDSKLCLYTANRTEQFVSGHYPGRWYVRAMNESAGSPPGLAFETCADALSAVRVGRWRR